MTAIYQNIFLTNPSWVRSCVETYTDVGQIGLPLLSGLYAIYKGDYEGFCWLALALLINQVVIEALKRTIPAIRPKGS